MKSSWWVFCVVVACLAGVACVSDFGGRSDSGRCVGSCADCATLDEGQCEGQSGCAWLLSDCVGNSIACETLGVQDCEARLECAWDPTPRCQGTCPDCWASATAGECTALGVPCTWADGGCSGSTTTLCSAFTQSECALVGGCDWIAARCYGPLPKSCTTITDETLCNAQGQCSWNGQCEGGTYLCSGIGNDGDCDLHTGNMCEWELAHCEGLPDSCYDRPLAGCIRECIWTAGECAGSCLECEELASESVCLQPGYCEWSAVSPCAGESLSCDVRNNPDLCQAPLSGCAWQVRNECTGTCETTCSSHETPEACLAQMECSWE